MDTRKAYTELREVGALCQQVFHDDKLDAKTVAVVFVGLKLCDSLDGLGRRLGEALAGISIGVDEMACEVRAQ